MSLFQRLNNLKKDRSRENKVKTDVKPVNIPGGEVITSCGEECVYLQEVYPGPFSFPGPANLCRNLRLLRGVGPVNESRLQEQGYFSIQQLKCHPRWGECASEVLRLLDEKNVHGLQKLGASDWDLLSFYDAGEVVFLDIESTGLWANQPLFLVGVMYCRDGELVSGQYFARYYGEEKAVLGAVDRLLQNFNVIVTYNGKSFDMPYITQRCVARGLFYRYGHYHVDLLYHARRHLKHLLPDCRLMTLEEYLLNFRREGDIPGYLIPQTYHRFVKTGDAGLVQPVIEHNKLDLLSMARLFYLVNPECPVDVELSRAQAAAARDT
ncbi:MAG: ribonuclease H-like domain-containing protein [Clostridiales bacterium]|nr:ribonuclease H-like domain-containing protein [Clostridiales bacterium]MCF8022859.1 ribonuclease H-like domain-containing protein [Clostridiales bacterium]